MFEQLLKGNHSTYLKSIVRWGYLSLITMIPCVFGEFFYVESPSVVERDIPFQIKVVFDNIDEEVKIYGDNFQFLGPVGTSISKTLINGRFSEKKVYIYRMKPENGRIISLVVELGSHKKEVKITVEDSKYKKKTNNINSKIFPQTLFNIRNQDQPFKDAVLIRSYLSKNKVLVNEPIIMETVIYSEFAVDSYQILKRYSQNCYQLTPLNKFISSRKPATIGNRRYLKTTIFKYIIYFPKGGECTIEEIPFRIHFIQPSFFSTKKVLDVNSLPVTLATVDYPKTGQPNDFQFHYGNYRLRLSISTNRPEQNTPVRLEVMISGSGNFIALNEPKIQLTPNFTLTKDKVVDTFIPNQSTFLGSKIYYYYLTPREIGKTLDTPIVTFSFFSPTTQNYIKLHKKVPNLEVIPYSGYIPTSEDSFMIASEEAEGVLYFYPPYIVKLSELKLGSVEIAGWYHFLGLISSLLFWIKIRVLPKNQKNTNPQHLYKKISCLKLKPLKKNAADKENPPWLQLKKLTVLWLQVFYDLNMEKSWDKEIEKMVISNSLPPQEIDILKDFQTRINRWEVVLYQGKKVGGKKFNQEVEATTDMLKKLFPYSQKNQNKQSLISAVVNKL